MANSDVDLYVSTSELLEAHEPARLLSELELTDACRNATRILERRGYRYGFRDSTPYWIHEFESPGVNLVQLPRRPVLSIVKVETVLAGEVTEESLDSVFIDSVAEGRIGASAGFGGSEDGLWKSGDEARMRRNGNSSVAGLVDRVFWRITYTGGKALDDEGKGVALALAKVRVDEIRAGALGDGKFAEARARILETWPQRVNG